MPSIGLTNSILENILKGDILYKHTSIGISAKIILYNNPNCKRLLMIVSRPYGIFDKIQVQLGVYFTNYISVDIF